VRLPQLEHRAVVLGLACSERELDLLLARAELGQRLLLLLVAAPLVLAAAARPVRGGLG